MFTSRVKMLDERPYRVWFRASIARTVVVDRDDRQDRPEDLLLADAVHRPDAGEDRRLEEVAVLEVAVGSAGPAGDQITLCATDVDVACDLVDRSAVDERPDVRPGVEAIAEAKGPSALLEALQEGLDDRALHDDP